MTDQFLVTESNRSTIVALIGAIEYWWDTPEEPNRFNSAEAVAYRAHRNVLHNWLVDKGYLVFSAHLAFKGPWDNRAQQINDYAIEESDVVICMSPDHIPGKGTTREKRIAMENGIPVITFPPGVAYEHLERLLEMSL